MKQNWETNVLKDSLSKLVDGKKKYRDNLKDEIIQEFCKSDSRKHWFLGFAMPMLFVAITELVRETHKTNPSVTFPQITDKYYREMQNVQNFLGITG